MTKIERKQEKGQMINFSEFCSANSYNGWLDMCDGHRLWEKYVLPIIPSLLRYYGEVIVKKKNPQAKVIAIEKYKKKITEKKGWCKAA